VQPIKDAGQAPGILHYVIIRGIEKRRIVDNAADRKDFLRRPGERSLAISRARAQIAIGLIKTHGAALAEAAGLLSVSIAAISEILKRAG
jgi:hypothetical protein